MRIIEQLRHQIAETEGQLYPLEVIAAAGSLGRLEAGPNSDLDAILVVGGNVRAGGESEGAADKLWEYAQEVGLRAPKPGGVFREPIARAALLDKSAIGRIDENPSVFGKRIQILLDARAVHGEQKFEELRDETLDWYIAPTVDFRMQSPWSYLLADLLRYGNSYSNWQRVKLNRTVDDSWALRQAKLSSTRLVTWMGLWLMIHQAQRLANSGVQWMREHLALTPLERVRLVIEPDSPARYARIHQHYEMIHTLMQGEEVRARLIGCELPLGGLDTPVDAAEFSEILDQCARMRQELSAFYAESLTRVQAQIPELAIPF